MTDILERKKLLDNPLVMDLIKINCEKERLQKIDEVEALLVDEDPTKGIEMIIIDATTSWNEYAEIRNELRADLRAKLEAMKEGK